MKKEELKQREEDINKIVNLLSSFGDHHMSEEELLRVSEAYQNYYHFLFQQVDLKLIINNAFLALAGFDLTSSPTTDGIIRDFLFILVTGYIDKYLLSHFISERMELAEERGWIKKFKKSKNRDVNAATVLKEKLKKYQLELEIIEKELKAEEVVQKKLK